MEHTTTLTEPFAGQHPAAPGSTLVAIWTTVVRWRRKTRAMAQLHALSDRSLADIGIDRSEIESVVWLGKADPTRRPR